MTETQIPRGADPLAPPVTTVPPEPEILTGLGEPTPEPTRGVSPGHVLSSGRRDRRRALPYRRIAGLVIIGIGVLIVLFGAYLFVFTPLTVSRNQQRLARSLVAKPLAVFSLVAGKIPPEGSPVAVLQIPVLGLRQIVVEGTSAADLMNGPGLLRGSALPGSPGNAVIAGRRVTFGGAFGTLGELRVGDRLHVVDGAGAFTYRVTRVFTVTAGQRDVVTQTRTNRLTLVTSDSDLVTSGRLVVRAMLVGRPIAVDSRVVAVPTDELGLTGDPVAGGLAALWTLLSVAVLVLAAFLAWRTMKPWVVYVFAMPVFITCGLFACASLARALPATF